MVLARTTTSWERRFTLWTFSLDESVKMHERRLSQNDVTHRGIEIHEPRLSQNDIRHRGIEALTGVLAKFQIFDLERKSNRFSWRTVFVQVVGLDRRECKGRSAVYVCNRCCWTLS